MEEARTKGDRENKTDGRIGQSFSTDSLLKNVLPVRPGGGLDIVPVCGTAWLRNTGVEHKVGTENKRMQRDGNSEGRTAKK